MSMWDGIYIYRDGQIYNDPRRKAPNSMKYDVPIGNDNGHGYLQICYQRKSYVVHRIIWEMHNGPIPDGLMIDHTDGDNTNNRIENLRLATRAQNGMNSKSTCNKKSGLPKGIYYQKSGNYKCGFKTNGKNTYLGTYKSLEEAESVIQSAREKYHQEFARHH